MNQTKPISSQNAQQILWHPKNAGNTQIERFCSMAAARSGKSFKNFGEIHQWSIEENESFWDLVWDFAELIGDKGGLVKKSIADVPWISFFPQGKISYTENILRHASKHPDQPAIIYRLQEGIIPGLSDKKTDRSISWKELYDQVSLWEQALVSLGLQEGDKIGVYLPNIPETVIILLAASNLGVVFCSAGMEMGPADLVNRFSQAQPKVFVSADGYVHGAKAISRMDVVQKARTEISSIQKTIIIPTISNTHEIPEDIIIYNQYISQFKPKKMGFQRRDFNHPLYILFSSGSTGKPKCFEHSTGGVLLKHMSEYFLHAEVSEGDRVFYHATPSWMMWNWLVSGLAVGATILMYDGSPAYPDAWSQWDFTAAHKATHHGTAAPVILSWEKAGIKPTERYDLSPLKMVLSTGAVLPSQGFGYIHAHVKKDVKIGSISGGTDIVGCFLGGNALTPEYAGQINGPMLGMDVQIWNDDGQRIHPGQAGELVCLNAFPSMPLRFLDDTDGKRYKAEYFEYFLNKDQPVWRHGDSVELTHQNQFVIIGRSDATLNQNGVRIGTIAIYDQLAPFAGQFKDAAAVDFTRPDNKQAITILFLAVNTPENGVPEALQKSIKAAIKDNITPYAIPTEIIAVPDILKTPNGKKAEVVMKKILAGKSVPNASLYGEDLVKTFEQIGQDLQLKYSGR